MFIGGGVGGVGRIGGGGRRGGTPAPTPSVVTSMATIGAYSDTASAVSPITTAGQSLPLDLDGWCLQINTTGGQTIADATKLIVTLARPGYDATGTATTVPDTCLGTRLMRRATPNQASALLATGSAFIVALDNLIYAADSIVSVTLQPGFFTGQTDTITFSGPSVTRNDALVYEPFAIRPITLPWRRCTNSIDVEFMAASDWARSNRQLACVRARWKSGVTYGPWATSATMVRSASTPASGRTVTTNGAGLTQPLALPVYSVTVDTSTCPDSTTRGSACIVYQAFDWCGNVVWDSEVNGIALQSDGRPSDLSPPAALPIIVDKAGNHAPIYAWVNRDGTAGGSAAIQTGTTDPGSAGSYASENAAFVAARAYNNANRGHNTTSGIVILYRDVAGSGLGDATTGYWQRATMSGFSDGLVPPVLCSAQYLTSGTTSTNCRRQGVQDDGTTAATSKNVAGVYEWRGIVFDSTGRAAANNIVLDGQTGGGASTPAAATTCGIFLDCDVVGNSSAGSSNPVLWRMGWRWDWRVSLTGVAGAQDLANLSTAYTGLIVSAGSYYSGSAAANIRANLICIGGCQFDNLGVWEYAGTTTSSAVMNPVDCIMAHSRVDYDTASAQLINIGRATGATSGLRSANWNGRALINVLVTKTSGTSPCIAISADGVYNTGRRIILDGIAADAVGAESNARLNFCYNDQGYIQLLKRGTVKRGAMPSYNTKDDTFAGSAGEFPSAVAAAWTATTPVVRGTFAHDGNATVSARVYYQAVADFTTGTVQATDLADAARWVNVGTNVGVLFGAQPQRTGNWRAQFNVRNWQNVVATTANGDTGFGTGSWAGEVPFRGGNFQPTITNWRDTWWTTRRTAGTRGDYRPAVSSPLRGVVPAGEATTPFDLIGVTRPSGATSCAGPLEPA